VKFDLKDYLELTKIHKNGCSFQAVISQDAVGFMFGCYYLPGLSSPTFREMERLIDKTKGKTYWIHDKELSVVLLKQISPHYKRDHCGILVKDQIKELLHT